MYKPALLALSVLLAAAPAWAQSAAWQGSHARRRAEHAAQRAGERPVDHGPFTPQANGAYQGGGVILQGAPGAPPPGAQQTPPGQVPQNAIPVR